MMATVLNVNMTIQFGPHTFLPADRLTTWNPGLMSTGGIPTRNTIFTTLTPIGGGSDDTSQIQTAINACPLGQVVLLSAGTFTFTGGNFILINKGVTLRGSGAGTTILNKVGGANMYPGAAQGSNPAPAIVVGTGRSGFWTNGGPDVAGGNTASAGGGGVNLTADGLHGTFSVTVADASMFFAGQIVILDELSGGQWMTDVVTTNVTDGYQIWASPDYKSTWKKHNPAIPFVDDFASTDFPYMPNTFGDFIGNRLDRPHNEIKEIASVIGNVVTFNTPIHGNYRTSLTAQLCWYTDASVNAYVPHVRGASVEQLTMVGFDDGSILFQMAAYCWTNNIEVDVWTGQDIDFSRCFKCECRRLYSHGSTYPQPGGGSYAICFDLGSSEILIEDCISILANKVLVVARRSGAGSVIGYCYGDMGYIQYSDDWCEIGLNASHLNGSHHVLLEGNYAFNGDSDNTHGPSTFMTYFRNHLSGFRHVYTNIQSGNVKNDLTNPSASPKRCAGCQDYSYWFSFVGNVLGRSGDMTGFSYTTVFNGGPGIWLMGWGADHNGNSSTDPQVTDNSFPGHIIRDGNWDWLQSTQSWHNTPGHFIIPNSMYLSSKPSFFGANTWPWVDPATGSTAILPAKKRFDDGVPN
jgi:hypothetical protein